MAAKDRKKNVNEIHPAWAMAGTALFAIAVAAPLVVINLSQSLRDAPGLVRTERVEVAENVSRGTEDIEKTERSFEAGFASATIEPGVGIGTLSLGQPLETSLDRMTEHLRAHFGHDEEGIVQHHSFLLGSVEVRLDSRPREGRIESIRLSIANCTDLEQSQPRQDGVPITADGLTIGSHQSRVIRRMGVPIKGLPVAPIPGPMRQPTRQVFDGITFEYCPDTQLVRSVRVNRSNGLRHDVELIATARPSSQAPSHPMTVVLAGTRPVSAFGTASAPHPATEVPLLAEMPTLVGTHPEAPAAYIPARAEAPADLSPDSKGLAVVSMFALAPVMDLPVRPDHPAQSLKSMVADTETGVIDRVASPDLRAPDALDQTADVHPRTEAGTVYELDTASLALPAFPGIVDLGVSTAGTETSAPMIARAPERPLGLASPELNGQPSALASLDHAGDQVSPLAEVKPGASLPQTRTHQNASLPPVAAADVSQPVYQSSTRAQLAFAPVDELVDQGIAPKAVAHLSGPPELAAEQAEASLGLNRTTRRKLQRRLSLIGYDPAGIDGIFGPNTRGAIAKLQADANLEPTGFLDAEVKELIEVRSRKPYAKWRKGQERLAAKRRAERRAATAAAPVDFEIVPKAKQLPDCWRGEDGKITSNQSFSCDVDLLQENFQESIQTLFSFRS